MSTSSSSNDWYFPGEFEKHSAIWLAWPTFENLKGQSSSTVQKQMIKELAPFVRVNLLVQSEEEKAQVQQELHSEGIPSQHVNFFAIPHFDIWMRDFGPIFLKRRQPAPGQPSLRIVHFQWNAWGYVGHTVTEDVLTPGLGDGEIPKLIGKEIGVEVVTSSLVSEGGDREFNGKGTLIVSEVVERQRNPHLSKVEIEAELKRVFNVTNVIWLQKGLVEDYHPFLGKLPGNVFTTPGTGGHVDEFARFVDERTIAVSWITEEERDSSALAAISYQNMQENYNILLNSVDQDGQPFRIVKLPTPKPLFITVPHTEELYQYLQKMKYDDGTVIPEEGSIEVVIAASYGNFLISNNVVLLPKYYKPGRDESYRHTDEEAVRVLQEVLPNHKIVQIDSEIVNIGGATVQKIQSETGAQVTVPNSGDGSNSVTVTGTHAAVERAVEAITNIINEHSGKQQQKGKQKRTDGEHTHDAEAEAAETDRLYAKFQKDIDEHARRRGELFDEASKEYEKGNKARAAELRDLAKEEGRKMEEAQKKASRNIFNAKNAKFDEYTIDLHGLHVEDALELLQERIDELKKKKKSGPQTLCVIYGAGNHSGKGGPLVKPAVRKMLEEKSLPFTEVNNGSVNVTL